MFFIYRLTDEVHDYYGQTEDPEQRFKNHKSPSNHTCRSKLLDSSKMKMHIIHRLYTQEEADETEEFYQLNFECINKNITGRTYAEWRLANKEKIIEERADYYQANKEQINKQQAEYYQENKDKVKVKTTEYYQKNKEKIKAQRSVLYECECGSVVRTDGKTQHEKSKKHQEYINQK